jgi:hypothetical protein
MALGVYPVGLQARCAKEFADPAGGPITRALNSDESRDDDIAVSPADLTHLLDRAICGPVPIRR